MSIFRRLQILILGYLQEEEGVRLEVRIVRHNRRDDLRPSRKARKFASQAA